MELYSLTIHELQDKLRAGEVTAADILTSVYQRIDQVEGKVHAYITLMKEAAQAQAAAADAAIRNGDIRALTGIPLALKDIYCVQGFTTTCGSRILHNFVPPYDATVVEKLRAAGAVFTGKANMDEFAMGSSTETSYFGVTRNPWDLTRIPGGSSGGSAAAVAADECIAALGSDTGGSIRQPAALCGIVGLKPTYGLVSRYGLAAYASSLDQIGTMARTVEDAALLLGAIAGHDERDSTSFKADVPDYRAELARSKGRWRLGVPKEFFGAGLDPEVGAAVKAAIEHYRATGCEIREVSLPLAAEYAIAVYYLIATAEASSNLARYDGVRYGRRSAKAKDAVDLYYQSRAEGFGDEVKRRIILGTHVLSSGYYDAYYLRAQKVRTLIRNEFTAVLRDCDALLSPTSPTAAFKLGEKSSDPLAMYLTDIYTISVNLAGLPGISVPCGFTTGGLPIGLQIIGRPFDEAGLLSIARHYEQAHGWYSKHPSL